MHRRSTFITSSPSLCASVQKGWQPSLANANLAWKTVAMWYAAERCIVKLTRLMQSSRLLSLRPKGKCESSWVSPVLLEIYPGVCEEGSSEPSVVESRVWPSVPTVEAFAVFIPVLRSPDVSKDFSLYPTNGCIWSWNRCCSEPERPGWRQPSSCLL